jgi:hypothetical protein
MGFFSDYNEAKKKADLEFKRKHPILASLAEDNNKKQPKKNNIDEQMYLFDLLDEEKEAIMDEGYDPEDFEDDEMDPDDYYNDEY